MVEKPNELEMAQMIDSICERYGCLPSQLLAEDISVLQIASIAAMGRDDVRE